MTKKKRGPFRALLPVALLSDAIQHLVVLSEAERAAGTYNGFELPEAISAIQGGSQSLLQGLIGEYGKDMNSLVLTSLKNAALQMPNANTFQTVNQILQGISISSDLPLYTSQQTSTDLTFAILNSSLNPSSIDALLRSLLSARK